MTTTTADPDPVILRGPDAYETFRIKASDGNYMAMIADPIRDGVPFNAFFEVFEPGGATPVHQHGHAHEMFFVLRGEGESLCEGQTLPIRAGDSFLVRPGHDHVVRNTGADKLYCLTVMVPNEGFAELVRSGIPMPLPDDDRALLEKGV